MRMANEGLLNCTENAGPSPVTSGRRVTGVFLEARSELKKAFEGLGAVGPEAN